MDHCPTRVGIADFHRRTITDGVTTHRCSNLHWMSQMFERTQAKRPAIRTAVQASVVTSCGEKAQNDTQGKDQPCPHDDMLHSLEDQNKPMEHALCSRQRQECGAKNLLFSPASSTFVPSVAINARRCGKTLAAPWAESTPRSAVGRATQQELSLEGSKHPGQGRSDNNCWYGNNRMNSMPPRPSALQPNAATWFLLPS